jgi:hypothetical protein
MSLQLAAQHLSDHGRGPDNTLVHMSHDEVKSLNDLAMAHGGQLTINPQTGLPEAGFLSAILPMVAGMALAPATGGASLGLTSAWQTAALVGAGSYLLNPKAGLMGALSAGLGGYGGAGLAGGLSGLATSEAGATAQNAATKAAADAEAQAVAERTAAIQQRAQGLTGNGLTFPGESTATGSSYTGTELSPKYGVSDSGLRWDATQGRVPAFDSLRTTALQPLTPAEIQNIRMGAIDASSNLAAPPPTGFEGIKQGISSVIEDPSKLKQVGGGSYAGLAKMGLAAAAPAVNLKSNGLAPLPATSGKQVVPHYRFVPGMATPTPAASATGVENTYFPGSRYEVVSDAEAQQLYPGYPDYAKPATATTAANGGLMGYAGGGPVEQMSNNNAIGANTGFPQAYLHNNAYATPYQTPISQNVLTGAGDTAVDPYTGEQKMATGGLSDAHYNLGGYSDGGRLLRGPGDGVSDSIPAVIGKKQPARLADGEFVVPARIVSELGNGSTEAGARKLYAMMDRIQASRKNTVGKGKIAKNNRADKYLPA